MEPSSSFVEPWESGKKPSHDNASGGLKRKRDEEQGGSSGCSSGSVFGSCLQGHCNSNSCDREASGSSSALLRQTSEVCALTTIVLDTEIPLLDDRLDAVSSSRVQQDVSIVVMAGRERDFLAAFASQKLQPVVEVHTLHLQRQSVSLEATTAAAKSFPTVKHLILGDIPQHAPTLDAPCAHMAHMPHAPGHLQHPPPTHSSNSSSSSHLTADCPKLLTDVSLPAPACWPRLTTLTLACADDFLSEQSIAHTIQPYVPQLTSLTLHGQYPPATLFSSPTTTLRELSVQTLDDALLQQLLRHAPTLERLTAQQLRLDSEHHSRPWQLQRLTVTAPDGLGHTSTADLVRLPCNKKGARVAVSIDVLEVCCEQGGPAGLLQRMRTDLLVSVTTALRLAPAASLPPALHPATLRLYTPALPALAPALGHLQIHHAWDNCPAVLVPLLHAAATLPAASLTLLPPPAPPAASRPHHLPAAAAATASASLPAASCTTSHVLACAQTCISRFERLASESHLLHPPFIPSA